MNTTRNLLLALLAAVSLSGCYFMRGSSGGGETKWAPPRKLNADDIAIVKGYKIEPYAEGLTFPTGITLDDKGRVYVVEAGYSYGEVFTTPRLLRIEPDGKTTAIAEGKDNGPWTSVYFYKGNFYVSEGGELHGGKILRITETGSITEIISGLPSNGDHHTNGAVIGPDGFIYFGQGTATNSGIVGADNAKFGWLKRKPDFHDIPCRDITLTGKNFETEDVLNPEAKKKVSTGAFSPYGTPTQKGQVIKGRIPCSGAIMRVPLTGGELDLVAWGFRNPFGLAFSPEGHLYATDNAYDDRGSRPVWGTGDVLWSVEKGKWYGWPDFSAGDPLKNEDFSTPGGEKLEYLIAAHPDAPPRPAAILGVHSSSNGIDFSRSDAFGYKGEAFIAQFGDQAPDVGKVLSPVGFRVVRVDVKTGRIEDFAVNKGSSNGPASMLEKGGLERPVSVKFSNDGNTLYIVDFGVMLMTDKGPSPQQKTGVIWKVTKGE